MNFSHGMAQKLGPADPENISGRLIDGSRCIGAMRGIALIEDQALIEKILSHLGLRGTILPCTTCCSYHQIDIQASVWHTHTHKKQVLIHYPLKAVFEKTRCHRE
jgi:hypothetical protein